MDIENLNYDDRGLIPAIIQDSISFNVLMLGYMNKDSIQHTLKTEEVTFLADQNRGFGLKEKHQAINYY